MATGFNPWTVTTASHRDWLELLPVKENEILEDETTEDDLSADNNNISDDNIVEDFTPTVEWKFDEGYEDVERVDLFISDLPQGQGL